MKSIFLITTLLTVTSTQVFAENYQIMVDAGSTGSKLHLFQYETTQDTPIIKDVFYENNKIPLSSFEKNPENAGTSLEKIFNDVEAQLKNKGINPAEVQINLLGTAGMRLLPEDKQAAIYKNVENFLKQHYSFPIGNIQTLSGKMEGLYAWLDVNYLANTFQSHAPSIGTLEMGGASMQIAFETSNTSKPEALTTVKVAGQAYTVFSKSFLGLGQDQARGQMNLLPAFESCYPLGYETGQSKGAWDFSQCASLYNQVIHAHQVKEQMIPTMDQPFYAFAGAYYTYQFFDADKTPDQANLEKRIRAICSKPWEDLKKDYPNVDDQYLSSYCAHAAYVNDLFYDALQIQGKQLNVVNQVNQQNIDWALGAVLYSLS